MIDARTLSQNIYGRLLAATKRLIKANGTAESAAMDTRVTESQLLKYQNANLPDVMPIDVVADLETTAGEPVVTRLLAELSGHALVKLPPAGQPETEEMSSFLIYLTETSEATQTISKALADDQHITIEEIRNLGLVREINDVIDAACNMRAVVQRIEAGHD